MSIYNRHFQDFSYSYQGQDRIGPPSGGGTDWGSIIGSAAGAINSIWGNRGNAGQYATYTPPASQPTVQEIVIPGWVYAIGALVILLLLIKR